MDYRNGHPLSPASVPIPKLGGPPSPGPPRQVPLARSFFVNLAPLYSGGRRKPAMAINGRRNKPIGPGGSTRRLHRCSGPRALNRKRFALHRWGRNRIDEGVKGALLLGMV